MNLPYSGQKITVGKPNPDTGTLWALVQESKVCDNGDVIAQVDYLQNGRKPTREWVVWRGDCWEFLSMMPCGTTLDHGYGAILQDDLARANMWSPEM